MLLLIEALSVIAAAFALYHRIQQGRSIKRLRKLLEQEQAKAKPADPEHEVSDSSRR